MYNDSPNLIFFVRVWPRNQDGEYPRPRDDTLGWVPIYPKSMDVELETSGGKKAATFPSETWLPAGDLRILGAHNVANALAAGLAAALAGCDGASIGRALAEFQGLPHRLEPVASIGDVLWVYDSKATNVAATLVAVRAFERPIVLILGGRSKGEPFVPLIPWLQGAAGVVAFGESAPQVVADLNGSVPAVHVEGSLESAVRAAGALARPGDVVLFSPACASFDMFRDYKDRGRAYRAAVERLERERRGG